MLTKRQVLACLRGGRTTKEKKALLKEVENSDREYFTDEEVQKLQIRSYKIQSDYERKNNYFPQNKAEWDAYNRVHHDGDWRAVNESRYDEYNGYMESIWD